MTRYSFKIPAHYAPLVGGLIMSACMSLGMSVGVTLIEDGIDRITIADWLHNLIVGFSINLPLTLLISPRVRRFIDTITEQ